MCPNQIPPQPASPELPGDSDNGETPPDRLWGAEEIQNKINARGIALSLPPEDLQQVIQAGTQLKTQSCHRERTQLSCWLLLNSQQTDTSVDSNGLHIAVFPPPDQNSRPYTAHVPFRRIPTEFISVLSTRPNLIRSCDLLEIRARRARYYVPGIVPDWEAEHTQMIQLGDAIGTKNQITDADNRAEIARNHMQTISEIILDSLDTESSDALIQALTSADPPVRLPECLFEYYISEGTDSLGRYKVDRDYKTNQWFVFAQKLSVALSDPDSTKLKPKKGKQIEDRARPDMNSLRRIKESTKSHFRESSYYNIAQMAEYGLRYGEFDPQQTVLIRTDVDDPGDEDHREILGIYGPFSNTSLLIAPDRHLSEAARASLELFAKPDRSDNISESPHQDLEIWFRPFGRFCELHRFIISQAPIRKDETYPPPLQQQVDDAIQESIRLLHTYLPDFKCDAEDWDRFDSAEAYDAYCRIYHQAFQEAQRKYPHDDKNRTAHLAETLAGGQLTMHEVEFGAQWLAQLQEQGVLHDPSLFTGLTSRAIEISTLNDRQMTEAMRSMDIIQRDTAFVVLGSKELEDPERQEAQNARYKEFFDILRKYPINILANENQCGGGVAYGQANIRHQQELGEVPAKATESARLLSIAPQGNTVYPQNQRLLPDLPRYWAISPVDAIVPQRSSKIEYEVGKISSEYQNILREEQIIANKLTKEGCTRVNILGNGGIAVSLQKIELSLEHPGETIIYKDLGRFGALIGVLLEHDQGARGIENIADLYERIQTVMQYVPSEFHAELHEELCTAPGEIKMLEDIPQDRAEYILRSLFSFLRITHQYYAKPPRIHVCDAQSLEETMDRIVGTEHKRG